MRLLRIGKVLLFGVAGILMLILTLMLGVKLALDRAPRYQAEIKEWVYRQTGYRIAFSHVSPAFRWYGPELYFDRLELRSKNESRVLARAAGGRVGADLWQLLHSGKLFALRIELDSPEIVVARVSDSTFALGSEVVLGSEHESSPPLALNDLPAGTVAIRRGFITVQGWNSALPSLKLRDVNLDLRRGNGLAALRVSAQLPTVLGGTLNFIGTARGAGRLGSLDWQILASTRGISFPGWRELLPEYLTRLDAGSGSFEVLAQGRGPTLTRAELDFRAQGVITNLSDEPGVKFAQISGLLTLTHVGDRWSLLGRRMLALSEGRRDPDSDFDVSWRGNEAGVLELRARANYMRAETLLPLVGLMPQKDLRDRLRDIAPTGEWTDMRVQLMRSAVQEPWKLQVHAQFRGMGFAPAGRAPGLRGLSGTLAGDESGGHVAIDTKTAVFNWPNQLPQPVKLAALKTTLYWKRTAEEFLVATPDIQMNARGASLQGRAAWQQPSDGSSPILSLVTTIDNGNAADAHLFFPRQNLSPPALAWLNRAFVAGHLAHAVVVFRGPVRHFPFRDGSGLFLARCNLDGMSLDYREGWPRVEAGAAQAEFRNEGMSVRIIAGRAGGLMLDSGEARFVDFKAGELNIHAAIQGDAADALQFLRATPLDGMAEHAFSGADARGPLKATLDLFLPFKDLVHRRVSVHVKLDGATLNRKGSSVMATDLSGDADIDGAQVAHADIRGRVLGGAFQMTARAPRNRPLSRTQLDFHGTFSGDALRSALSLPASISVSGQSDWHGVLKMAPEPARERSLRLTSNLVGLELNLPEPLAKPSASLVPTTVETQWPPSGVMQVRVVFGAVLRAALILDSDGSGTKLSRAEVAFGSAEPTFSDAQIVNVGGNIERLDLGGWLKLGAPAKSAKPLASYLRSAKLAVARVDYLGLSFLDVAFDLSQNDGGWRISLGGPNVLGTISLPGPPDAAEPLNVQFERLTFADARFANARPAVADASQHESTTGDAPPTDAMDVNAPDADAPFARPPMDPELPADPHNIPAINFHAAEVTWDDRQIGEVRATLARLDDGVSLKQLSVVGQDFTAQATGEWRGKDGGTSRIEGTISSTDAAETLRQLGFAAVLEAKSGHLDFDMSWIGAPTGQSIEAATGHVQVALDKGQIVRLKPGAGRVLGLASVAELPRRLALDFSDLTDKGFAFDTIRGDFDLQDGSAYTDNVLVKGPAAEIGLIGRVGLKNKDYDQTAVVTGSVGSSPLPFAAFAAGPVIGGAVLLFTQVFKQPLKGLVRGYYRITGSWDNPTVERIKSADAAATAEAPK